MNERSQATKTKNRLRVSFVGTTILIADDDQETRSILKRLLEKDRELDVVGEASDGAEAVHLALELSPNLILMDLAMPHMNGLDATRRIKANQPETKVIIFTQYREEAYRRAAGESGADAFLSKQIRMADLLTTIRQVADGVSGEKTP